MGVCCSIPRNKGRLPTLGYCISASNIDGLVSSNIRKHYTFIKVIGHGSFGTVREAVRKNRTSRNERFAIKSIPVQQISSLTELKIELEVLRTADHPNIVKLFETYEDSHYVHIVMELCTGGDLMSICCSSSRISEYIVAGYMSQICRAVSYLHSMNFIHRDLKPENFLFTTTERNSQIKIIDFGLSAKYKECESLKLIVGTPYYIAPEVLNKQYGPQCDIWSLGVILYTLISGTPPFSGHNNEQIFQKILTEKLSFKGEIWDRVSSDCKDLIKLMLKKESFIRIDIKRVLEHPWFVKFKEKKSNTVPLSMINSLLNYHQPNKLKKSLMKIIIRHMNFDEINSLSEIFRTFDTRNTGKIILADIIKTIEGTKNYKTVEKVRRYLQKNPGFEEIALEYSDFILATLDTKQYFSEELLQDVFYQVTNDDQTGGNLKNIQASLASAGIFLTLEEIEGFIKEMLDTSSASIDYLSFKEIVMKAGSRFMDDTPLSGMVDLRNTF